MQTLTIDTLAYTKRLKQAGFTEKQAEVQAEIQAETLSNLVDGQLATKQDIKDLKNDIKNLETDLKSDIKDLNQQVTGLKKDMKESESNLKRDIKELELKLFLKLGALMAGGIGIFAALIKLL